MKLTWRIWLLLIVLGLSLLAIRPSFESGALVKSVQMNSEIYNQGLRAGEIIKDINGKTILDKADYTSVVGEIFSGVVSGQQKIEINT